MRHIHGVNMRKVVAMPHVSLSGQTVLDYLLESNLETNFRAIVVFIVQDIAKIIAPGRLGVVACG